MVILYDKWLYVSTMKNGTHSMYEALTMPPVGAHRIGAKMHPTPRKRLAPIHFSVCRNPYARAVSIWASTCIRESSRHQYAPYLYIKSKGGDPEQFRDFAHYVLADKIRESFRNPWLFLNQTLWQDQFILDRVFRLERLEEDLAEEMDIHVTLGRGNASHHDPWESYYDEDTRKVVQGWAGDDFKRFGYEL